MDVPEKSTQQLVPWLTLMEAIHHLDRVWEHTYPAVERAGTPPQLPANISVALAQALERGLEVVTDVTAVLAAQSDSGATYSDVAAAQQKALDEWRLTRRARPGA
ncbi:hypothetical protein [Saccharopolyspora taberi]|uniref:Uncharacterized protein n=1 Tax=Saccharopolyspora taberi TaxID=60895 RepID=A0ABN3V0N9_9PSEU